MWTVLIVLGDCLLSLRAGRMQVALAVGAIVEACTDHLAALRARIRERLPHQEIENEADRKIRRREDDDEKGPQSRAHAASLRIAVYVRDHEDVAREEDRDASHDSGQRQ